MNENAYEGFLIALHPIGKQVKVSAIDPQTHTEVSIIVPRNTHKSYAISLAVKKLQFVMAKNKDHSSS